MFVQWEGGARAFPWEESTMTDRKQAKEAGKIKAPEEWTTGDEPMTGAQGSDLHTLAREAGEDVPDELTKAEASEKIDDLRAKTGRGAGGKARATRGRGRAQPGRPRR
jgi:hypothetical protein